MAAAVVWCIVYRSRWGYEIRLIGDNPQNARYAGINIARNTILVMMLSGALAGLAGMSEVTGVVHRLQKRISPGYGFTGIIIAWLAKLNPLAVIIVSILSGGDRAPPCGTSRRCRTRTSSAAPFPGPVEARGRMRTTRWRRGRAARTTPRRSR